MTDDRHEIEAGSAAGPAETRRDAVLGAIFAGFGAAMLLWIIPAQVQDVGSFGLPPSFAPRVLAWLIMGFGLLLVALNARGLALRGGRVLGPAALTRANVRHLVLTIGAVAAMLALMKAVGDRTTQPFVGFFVAAPLGVVAFTLIHRNAPLWAFALNALALPLFVYLVFWLGLGLPLP